jgi:hypothetical protein
MPEQNKRYTPKKSIESLRQKWMAVSEHDPRLNSIGRVLARAAQQSSERFETVCRELEPEQVPDGARG